MQIKAESNTEDSLSMTGLSTIDTDELDTLRRSSPIKVVNICDHHLQEIAILTGNNSSDPADLGHDIFKLQGELLLLRGKAHHNLLESEQARTDLESALEIFEKLGFEEGISRTYVNLGLVVKGKGDLALAMECHHRALEIARRCGFTRAEMASHLNIGNNYYAMGDFSNALEHYQQSHQINSTLNHKLTESSQLSNIGLVYRELKQYDRALENFKKSLKILEEGNDKQRQVQVHSNIVGLYSLTGQLDEARRHAQKGWELAEEVAAPNGLVFSLSALADIEVMECNYPQALKLFEQALVTSRESRFFKGEVGCLIELGKIHIKTGEFENARTQLLTALNLADKLGQRSESMRIHELLADYFENVGDSSSALKHFRQFHTLERELLNQETTSRTMALQTWHASEQSLKEAEIHRLKSVELVKANKELQDLHREKNEFLSIAAHDLKNQLSAIVLACSVVHKSPERFSELDLHRQINSIGITAEHMREIILNLLDVNRLENGKIDIFSAAFNICSTLSTVAENYRQRADAKEISINVSCAAGEVFVFADRDLCKEVIENLLSNAIKFSPLGRSVQIGATRHHEFVQIFVQDEGPGISEADRRDLFGKFSRLSAKPTANEHSTGLGLWIVKKLVDAMGGRVWCEATESHGARFVIELPAA